MKIINLYMIMAMQTLMSTKEVAEYLRLKERKIYDLVAQRTIPHSRVSGKLLFPRLLIEEWVNQGLAGNLVVSTRNAPAVIAGSSDPLLEWAIRESRCGLASMTYGSSDGFNRLLAGEACAAAIHLPTSQIPSERSPNKVAAQSRLASMDCVLLHWAKREQGLLVSPKNPKKIRTVIDLKRKGIKTIARQTGAGSYLLLLELLKAHDIEPDMLQYALPVAQTEIEIAMAILDGRADVGLAVRAVAQQFHLEFIPLTTESLDIAVLRPSYFDSPMQTLFEFTKTVQFKRYAKSLAGYDVSNLGTVVWNA
jgi:putative molybdopterin biosynthesis protein